MHKKLLVDTDIPNGARLVEALDGANVPIAAAFWLYSDEADEWRLILVSPMVSILGPRHVYASIVSVLKQASINIPIDAIFVIAANDVRYL